MLRVFNMGVGMIALVAPKDVDSVLERLEPFRESSVDHGRGGGGRGRPVGVRARNAEPILRSFTVSRAAIRRVSFCFRGGCGAFRRCRRPGSDAARHTMCNRIGGVARILPKCRSGGAGHSWWNRHCRHCGCRPLGVVEHHRATVGQYTPCEYRPPPPDGTLLDARHPRWEAQGLRPTTPSTCTGSRAR